MSGVVHRAGEVGEAWPEIMGELTRAFEVAREAATQEQSFVFVVRQDDLLGRRGSGNAMVAAGLLSAARTAALEGTRKGWTANVVALDDEADPGIVEIWTRRLVEDGAVTGELIRIGPGHIGKALP
jgi:hypothetical protein